MNSNTLSEENIFESDFIPTHYYPYRIRLYNLFSFEYVNKQISQSVLALFSITRKRGNSLSFKKKYKIKYTATYNIYHQYYSFDGKKFITYDELLNYVKNFK
jgi:hypothetical protein